MPRGLGPTVASPIRKIGRPSCSPPGQMGIRKSSSSPEASGANGEGSSGPATISASEIRDTAMSVLTWLHPPAETAAPNAIAPQHRLNREEPHLALRPARAAIFSRRLAFGFSSEVVEGGRTTGSPLPFELWSAQGWATGKAVRTRSQADHRRRQMASVAAGQACPPAPFRNRTASCFGVVRRPVRTNCVPS